MTFSLYSILAALRIYPTFKFFSEENEKVSRALDYKHRKKMVHFTDCHKETLDVWRAECGKQMSFPGYFTVKYKYFIMK